MSTFSLRRLVLSSVGLFVFASAGYLQAQEVTQPRSPELGVPVNPTLLLETTVLPDGRGLPEGSGNVDEGRRLYERHCLACHGPEGRDGINDALVGGQDSLSTAHPVKTIGSYWPYATTLFSYIRSAMPYNTPGTLSNSDTYALTAYLLHLNGLVAADATMTATSLPDINMPNAPGFRLQF